jgi:hypothetical protein
VRGLRNAAETFPETIRTRCLLTDALNHDPHRTGNMVIRFISVLVIGAALLLGTTLIVVSPQQSQASNLTSPNFRS